MLLHWMYNNSNNHNSGKVYVYNIFISFFCGYIQYNNNTQKKSGKSLPSAGVKMQFNIVDILTVSQCAM